MHLQNISCSAFHRHATTYLEPAVIHKWHQYQEAEFEFLSQRKVKIGGDIRADSPGKLPFLYSNTYSVMTDRVVTRKLHFDESGEQQHHWHSLVQVSGFTWTKIKLSMSHNAQLISVSFSFTLIDKYQSTITENTHKKLDFHQLLDYEIQLVFPLCFVYRAMRLEGATTWRQRDS